MSASQRYLGARTAFGVIIHVTGCVYNPEAIVRAKDGSTRPYRLPFLIAHGLELANTDRNAAVSRDQTHTRRCKTEITREKPSSSGRRINGVHPPLDPALNRSGRAKHCHLAREEIMPTFELTRFVTSLQKRRYRVAAPCPTTAKQHVLNGCVKGVLLGAEAVLYSSPPVCTALEPSESPSDVKPATDADGCPIWLPA